MQSESEFESEPEVSEEEDDRYSSEGSGSEYIEEEESSLEQEIAEQENGEPDTAEKEIENDFDRLVDSIRHKSSSNLLSKDWDISIQEKDSEFKDDLRGISGIGKRKGKKGRRRGPPLSHQVRAMIGEGNQAYVNGNLPETISIMQEVIRIEPRAASAWSVIAQCYDDMKDSQKALQLRIMAAHLNHDAEEWERLALQSRELGYNQQALYCYRKVYSLDPENVHALWDRAFLAKEVGDLKIARHSFLNILKRFPHDLTVLDELRPILVELGDLELCTTLFQDAFDHFRATMPMPPPEPQDEEIQVFTLFHLLILADLYNTTGAYEKAVQAIRRGYRWLQGRDNQKFWDLCEDDREWDVLQMYGANMEGVPDEHIGAGWRKRDNTMPPGGYPLDVNARHRLGVARIRMGDVEEGRMHSNVVLEQDVLDYAPLFAEIADAFFDQGLYSDARPIYETLGADAVTSSIYILKQTAICLRMNDDLKEAADVYEQVRLADPSDNDVKMKLAEIYEIMNEPRKALELVHEVIASRRHTRRENLAGSSDKHDAGGSSSLFDEKTRSRVYKNRDKKLSPAQIKAIEAERIKETQRGYARCNELWEQIEARKVELKVGEDDTAMQVDKEGGEAGGQDATERTRVRPLNELEREWLMEAEKLTDTFRETRSMFLSGKKKQATTFKRHKNVRQEATGDEEADEDRMVDRLQLDLELVSTRRRQASETTFRQIKYDDWMQLFLQYAFMLTRKDQYETADEILRHLLLSSSFQSRDHQLNLRLALITISTAAKRYPAVVENCRKLINMYQFNNEPMRLMFASLASGLAPTEIFIASTLQKHIYREMKLATKVVNDPSAARWHDPTKRWAPGVTGGKSKAEADDDVDEEEDQDADDASASNNDKTPLVALPISDNPMFVAAYGQICNAAKSYQSALFYLLHAYDWCPEDPMVCLSLAIASIGRAMQRQADNRNHLITQGIAFLSQYRTLRSSFRPATGEVDFNFGRLFHQLGLFSLAVKHYEIVLKSAEGLPPEQWGVAREAAYNLAMIYVTTGARPLAESLYRRWLTL